MPFPVDGVFDDGHARTKFAGRFEITISQQAPSLSISLADFSVPPDQGDTVVVPQLGVPTTYQVSDIQPDGLGGARLILQRP
jgi:hypothetical protein